MESIAGWVDNANLKDGTGALTPVSDETPLNSNYTVARGFIYDRFDSESPDLISVGVTVTGTPTLSSIAPNDGDQGDSVAVTLTGYGFRCGRYESVRRIRSGRRGQQRQRVEPDVPDRNVHDRFGCYRLEPAM